MAASAKLKSSTTWHAGAQRWRFVIMRSPRAVGLAANTWVATDAPLSGTLRDGRRQETGLGPVVCMVLVAPGAQTARRGH